MDLGFNIIQQDNPDIFDERVSLVSFLKAVEDNENLPYDIAVTGLDTFLYYAENRLEASRIIRDILEDNVNYLLMRNYIIQIVLNGELEVTIDNEKPKVKYKGTDLEGCQCKIKFPTR